MIPVVIIFKGNLINNCGLMEGFNELAQCNLKIIIRNIRNIWKS
jgi:hypothetical protein